MLDAEMRQMRRVYWTELLDQVKDQVQSWFSTNESDEVLTANIVRTLRPLRQQFVDIPKIVCLCGSSRFKSEFEELNKKLTFEGVIVLSIGCYPHADAIANGFKSGNKETEYGSDMAHLLDELHKRKIDLADEVLIINKGGYIGSSTASEINYALERGKVVRYIEDPTPPSVAKVA